MKSLILPGEGTISVLLYILISFFSISCIQQGNNSNPEQSDRTSPRIVNIVNFIRQNEPRIDWITEDVLYETVVEQIKIMKQYNLKGSFLLQYDALIDTRYQNLLKDLPAEQFEIGVWWEIPQPL